ncbi:heme exporter protein D [Cricetibacter osteomyelitidis]|uniref:Heme exporter protein D n=1 Tax=Cricetibacter osteomyelitidis TaxID=1521931 RepID=A0A4R2SML9_9PAST|nr:heme exporter protein CcmD [Cricetibacter osteomyelitidis]TCP91277.1 heme exporter protein D [Cricetibacter osteomyelitidis]
MFFETWNDFLNMGGYGFYVWLAYGVSLVTIAGLAVQSIKGKNAIFNEICKEQQREARMKQHSGNNKGATL